MKVSGNSTPSNEQIFCWEQVQRVNPMFRISRIFAPPENATALLGLHALLAAVEETCVAGIDEQVAQQKLAWWQQECLGRAAGTSRHPILKLLHASGVSGALDSPAMASLFESAFQRIDAPSPGDEAELLEFAARVSRPALELEASLSGLDGPGVPASLVGALPAAGVLQLIRESATGTGQRQYWWLPLSLQARHGTGRGEVAEGATGGSASAMLQDLIGQATAVRNPTGPAGHGGLAERHLQVTVALQRRVLARLGRSAPSDYARHLRRVSLGDVFTAWSVARRFSRLK